jgi:hypothetical protein
MLTEFLLLAVVSQASDFSYRETDLIPGTTTVDRLKHISQRDLLEGTKADAARCGPAAMLNAYLLLGGDWTRIARRLGVGETFTFEHVHLAQEALYNLANQDGVAGVFGGYLPDWGEDGGAFRGWKLKPNDEAHRIFQYLGLEFFPLYGPTKDQITRKQQRVEEVLSATEATVLIVGVDEEFKEAVSHPVKPGGTANHYTLAFRQGKTYFMLDPWAKVGQYSLRQLSDSDVRMMLFETLNPIIAVRLKR